MRQPGRVVVSCAVRKGRPRLARTRAAVAGSMSSRSVPTDGPAHRSPAPPVCPVDRTRGLSRDPASAVTDSRGRVTDPYRRLRRPRPPRRRRRLRLPNGRRVPSHSVSSLGGLLPRRLLFCKSFWHCRWWMPCRRFFRFCVGTVVFQVLCVRWVFRCAKRSTQS